MDVIRYSVKREELKRYIKYYWEVKSFIEKDVTNMLLPVINDDIIIYNSSWVTYHFQSGDITTNKSVFQGPRTSCIYLTQPGKTTLFGVTFKKYHSICFIDKDLKILKDSLYDLNHIFNYRDPDSFIEIVDSVESKLLTLLNRKKAPKDDDITLMDSLLLSESSIGDFCSLKGINIKKLERLFIKYTGITPKQFIKIFRAQRANNEILYNRVKSLTELSQDMGYFDQTHMGKDFKSIHGKRPVEFLKDNFTFKSSLKND